MATLALKKGPTVQQDFIGAGVVPINDLTLTVQRGKGSALLILYLDPHEDVGPNELTAQIRKNGVPLPAASLPWTGVAVETLLTATVFAIDNNVQPADVFDATLTCTGGETHLHPEGAILLCVSFPPNAARGPQAV